MRSLFAWSLVTTALCSCSSTGRAPDEHMLDTPGSAQPRTRFEDASVSSRWEKGVAAYQGFVGVGALDTVTLEQNGDEVEVDSSELDSYPVLGGGAQWKFWGERADLGLELMFSASWRADAEAIRTQGGGGVVAVDVDTLIIDVFGGPFVSVFLGERVRAYAAAGPTIQFLDYSQEDDLGNEADGSGVGVGVYARAGIEFSLRDNLWLGIGVRRTSTTVDLDSDVGEFDVDATQAVLTVTTGI